MPKNTKPRRKYSPRAMNCPITRGELDKLGQDLRFALMSIETAGGSAEAWVRLSRVLLIVSLATEKDTRFPAADHLLLDSAILTVRSMVDRAQRLGVWKATLTDALILHRGVDVAERLIPRLDVRRLAISYREMRRMMGGE